MLFSASISTPIGPMLIEANDAFVTKIIFSDQPIESNPSRLTDLAALQLHEYFAKRRAEFDLPLAAVGSGFQQHIMRLVAAIPFGKTITYSELTSSYGDDKAIRAVASANGKNQYAIVIPCHRVLGKNGNLTGYAWGLQKKEWLLMHENALPETLFSTNN